MRQSFIYRKATPLLCGRLARCPQLLLVQEDEGQHQHHLLSPGWTVEQVQITLADSDHLRDEEGRVLPR